jgi:hypothetical protein
MTNVESFSLRHSFVIRHLASILWRLSPAARHHRIGAYSLARFHQIE